MKHLAARLLTMLFTVALGCALCLVLYYKDNKYTSPGPQGIDGLLVLREADLTEDQIHYLIHGWAFYPDVLFTPAQLQEEGDDRYMTYCAIGEKPTLKPPPATIPTAAAAMCSPFCCRRPSASTPWSCRRSTPPTGSM